jgi:hypothetical protein
MSKHSLQSIQRADRAVKPRGELSLKEYCERVRVPYTGMWRALKAYRKSRS